VVRIYYNEATMAEFDTEGNVTVVMWLSANGYKIFALHM